MLKTSSNTTPQSEPYLDQLRVSPRSTLPVPSWLQETLIPKLHEPSVAPSHTRPRMLRAREQILTGLLRLGAFFGTLALLVAALPWLNDTPPQIYAIDTALLVVIWLLGIYRNCSYLLRSGLFMLALYAIAYTELVHYGFSQDATILFAFFSLLALLFLGMKVGAITLALSITTLGSVGLLIGTGQFTPLAHPMAELSISTAITTCMIFLLVVGCIQMGITVLLNHLDAAWQYEYEARALLIGEHELLEQRVAERTQELALAHERAEAVHRSESAQKEYLAALHQLTLELLNHHEISEVLQILVDRSATILNAPYGELMLCEGDELVVCAFTTNQRFLLGDRVRRDEAKLSWQAYDTGYPAVVDDYSHWIARRQCYDGIILHAVADFPILVGALCIGVLALGRAVPGHTFTPDDIQKGTLFAQLAGLVVENARLYNTALTEIAERAKAEQALREQAAELQAQNAELDAFARTVAHDLKTPLTGLIGHSQLLLELGPRLAQQDIDESLTSIVRVGQKMATIINELLLLARVRSLAEMPLGTLQMRDIIEAVEARLHRMISTAGAKLDYPEEWPTAFGYAPWVEEVWANYISNAVKYGGSPPIVQLGAAMMDSGFVRFWVQDNGAGLSAEQQARLFTPFTRLHSGDTPGHGLGLTIVERIVTRLGGQVGVESVLGRGCRFFFTLPIPPDGGGAAAPSAAH